MTILFALLLSVSHASLASYLPVPLRLMTCELLLDPKLRDLSHTRDIRKSLDGLIEATERGQAGDAGGLRFKNSERLLKRWRNVRVSLDSGDPDRQVVALELRGAEIQQAYELLASRAPEMRDVYNKEIRALYHPAVDIGAGAFNLILGYNLIHSAIRVANGTSIPADIFGMLVEGPMFVAYNAAAAYYHSWRFDWSYGRFRRELAKDPRIAREPVATYSRGFMVPTRFHRELMRPTGVSDEARREAILGQGGPHWFMTVQMIRSHYDLKRRAQDANDIARQVDLDQVLYFDREARELVWLSFYRQYRGKRIGGWSKPKDSGSQLNWAGARREQTDASLERVTED